MLNSLLATNQIVTWVIFGVLIVAIIGLFIFSSRRRKKQEKDAQDLISAVQPGNKVKTICGICGIVVEVDNEEQTFVLETGTEQS
ncbi:MAG: preprotein translocase subunit YajC, partial [Clostridia bacterium]|nr:preprotein translocase subunit YajC [Clostridia bacterium]